MAVLLEVAPFAQRVEQRRRHGHQGSERFVHVGVGEVLGAVAHHHAVGILETQPAEFTLDLQIN